MYHDHLCSVDCYANPRTSPCPVPIILWHLSPFGWLAKLVETALSISLPLCLSDITKFVNYAIVPRPHCTWLISGFTDLLLCDQVTWSQYSGRLELRPTFSMRVLQSFISLNTVTQQIDLGFPWEDPSRHSFGLELLLWKYSRYHNSIPI